MKSKIKFQLALLTMFFIAISGFCQIPAGYYDNAVGKTGDSLRAALRDITKTGQVKLTYAKVYTSFATTDVISPADTVVWDMYSNCNYTVIKGQCTGGTSAECKGYAREHCMPNSWWGGIDDANHAQYTDLNQLFPADQYVNQEKSNHPIGQVTNPTFTSINGSKVGPCSWTGGTTGTVFEPIDEYKGDFARAWLYVATRYMDSLSHWVNSYQSVEASEVINSTGNNYKQWFVDMLVKWSVDDPVSQKEIDRNNNIYYNTSQHNRNPFIDHPEYVCKIWSSTYCPAQSIPKTINEFNNQIVLYPNPATDKVICSVNAVTNSKQTLEIFNYLGQNIFNKNIEFQNGNNNIEINISAFQKGLYCVFIRNASGEIIGSKQLVVK